MALKANQWPLCYGESKVFDLATILPSMRLNMVHTKINPGPIISLD